MENNPRFGKGVWILIVIIIIALSMVGKAIKTSPACQNNSDGYCNYCSAKGHIGIATTLYNGYECCEACRITMDNKAIIDAAYKGGN